MKRFLVEIVGFCGGLALGFLVFALLHPCGKPAPAHERHYEDSGEPAQRIG